MSVVVALLCLSPYCSLVSGPLTYFRMKSSTHKTGSKPLHSVVLASLSSPASHHCALHILLGDMRNFFHLLESTLFCVSSRLVHTRFLFGGCVLPLLLV